MVRYYNAWAEVVPEKSVSSGGCGQQSLEAEGEWDEDEEEEEEEGEDEETSAKMNDDVGDEMWGDSASCVGPMPQACSAEGSDGASRNSAAEGDHGAARPSGRGEQEAAMDAHVKFFQRTFAHAVDLLMKVTAKRDRIMRARVADVGRLPPECHACSCEVCHGRR